ncbi:MAG: amidase [Polyangiaceae bacterium]
MFELPQGRITGTALRALVKAVRHTPAHRLTSAVLRQQLGIEDLKRLPEDARLALPMNYLPVRARPDHGRASEDLGTPADQAWPRTTQSYARALREGRITSDELCERAFVAARDLERQQPSLGPLCETDEQGALEAARAAAERLRNGNPLGPLDGVPLAIKEEIDFAGLPTRLGTGWMPNTPAGKDSTCVDRLRKAGAVLLGQTPMTEYGLSPLGGNVHRAMPRNAHNPGHLPGGSSSGSGVAVATGVTPVTLGVDGGGSIRIPACFNGVFGLKPTFGLIPATGHGSSGGSSVVHLGPIGASSYDLAVFLEATAGTDWTDTASLPAPAFKNGELVEALGRGVRGLKIGVIESEWDAASHEVSDAGHRALRALEAAGAELVQVKLPLIRHAAAMGYLTIGLEIFSSMRLERAEHMDRLGLDVQLLMRGMEAFASDDYLDAQRLRARLRTETAKLLSEVDVLALPTTAATAPPISDAEAAQGFVDPPALEDACRFAFLGNLTGIPAGTAPVGLGAKGLPIGLQILGDAYDEACVLAVLAALERTGAARAERPASGLDLLDL